MGHDCQGEWVTKYDQARKMSTVARDWPPRGIKFFGLCKSWFYQLTIPRGLHWYESTVLWDSLKTGFAVRVNEETFNNLN